MQPFFVDSYAPLTEEAITHLLSISNGVMPLAWGRYIDADLTHDIEVAAKYDIPLILIARRSARVPHVEFGAPDGASDRARCEQWVKLAKEKGARVVRRVFLDVEQEPNLVAGYWRAWSREFDGSELVPCAYMPNRNYWPASWGALESAVAAGARCGGTWVALYREKSDGSAVLRDEPWLLRPHASEAVPYLAWQCIGNAYSMRYDFSEVNPEIPAWLGDTLGPAPTPEVPRANDDIGPAPVTSAAQES